MTVKPISKEEFRRLLKETAPVMKDLYFLFDKMVKALLTKSIAKYKEQRLTGKQAEAKAQESIDPILMTLRDSYRIKFEGMENLIRADQYYQLFKIQTQAIIDIDEASFALDLIPTKIWNIILRAQGKKRPNKHTYG